MKSVIRTILALTLLLMLATVSTGFTPGKAYAATTSASANHISTQAHKWIYIKFVNNKGVIPHLVVPSVNRVWSGCSPDNGYLGIWTDNGANYDCFANAGWCTGTLYNVTGVWSGNNTGLLQDTNYNTVLVFNVKFTGYSLPPGINVGLIAIDPS